MVATGAAFALPLAIVATRLFRAMLFDVGPASLVSVAAATAAVSVTSIAGAILPAHTATDVDPKVALQHD